jgi:hypothetical protein
MVRSRFLLLATLTRWLLVVAVEHLVLVVLLLLVVEPEEC